MSNPSKQRWDTSQNNENHDSASSSKCSKRCFKCQGFRHIVVDCPNRRVITLLEEDINEEPTNEHAREEEIICVPEEEVLSDCGEALVVHRNLNATMLTEDESWLRHNIFYTRCTVKAKVCKVIIDSGSCENVVTNYMVEKLKLSTMAHPHPYKLQWLRKENEVKVTRQCCIQFSIGSKYQDEVWCDVIPMDACHLLLGRPWQYDREAIHDWFKNTYSFIKDDIKIVLTPLRHNDDNQEKQSLISKSSQKAEKISHFQKKGLG